MMYSKEQSFFRVLAISIAPGVSYYGTVEICVNVDDVAGWWVRSVMASDRGAHREVSKDWAKLVREAIDRDTALCDEITGRCVREMGRAKERGQTA